MSWRSLTHGTLVAVVLAAMGSSAAACAQVLGFDKPYVESDGGVPSSSGTGGVTGTGGTSGTMGTGGMTGTGGTAPAAPCATVADCPGQDTACSMRACTAGFCVAVDAPLGTPIATQTAGNCQKLVCDGHGALTLITDDTNVPNDDNPCTQDVCTAGVPSNPPVKVGTSCGGALTCDGQGHCAGCTTPAQCPGMDTECEARSCTGGVCGFLYTAAGTAVMAQTAGDCTRNVCNGMGAVTVIFDNSDVPVSTNPCVIAGCSMGSPTMSNTAAGAACTNGSGGTVCDGSGSCVQCLVPTSCPGMDTECQTRTCTGNTCAFAYQMSGTVVSTQTPGDCKQNVCNGMGGIGADADDADVPTNGTLCDTASCSGGMPVLTPVASGTSCGTMKTCNGTGSCTGCTVATDCPGTDTDCQKRTCSTAGVCGFAYTASGTATTAQTLGDCKENECNGMGGVSVVVDNADLPAAGPCLTGVCSNGVPSTPPAAAGTACAVSGGTVCNGAGVCGVCVPGTSRACCGVRTVACCGGCPTCITGVACCCDTSQDCAATGQWGVCY